MAEPEPMETKTIVPDEKQWQHITKLRRNLRMRQVEECAAKSKHKIAKENTEAAQDELNTAIDSVNAPMFKLMRDDGDWQDVGLAELEITGKAAQILTDNELTTLGKIAAWQDDNHTSFQDLKGCGDVMAEEISEKLDKYWAENPLPGSEEPETE